MLYVNSCSYPCLLFICNKSKKTPQVHTWIINDTLVLYASHDVGIAEDTYYKWIDVFCNVWVRTYRYFTIACLNRDLHNVFLDIIYVFDIAKNEIFC